MNDMARITLLTSLFHTFETETTPREFSKDEVLAMLRTICGLMERDKSLLVKRRSYSSLR